MNSFQEAMQSILNSKVNNSENIARDYLSESALYSLEVYTEFLDELPKDKHLEVAQKLIKFLISYDNDSLTNSAYAMQQLQKSIKTVKDACKRIKGEPIEKIKTPSIEIKNDIKALEIAKEVLMKNFNATTSTNKPMFVNSPIGLMETFSLLDNMIGDLKKKEFKTAKKSAYYEYKPRSKTPLKNYLNEICKKYNLKPSNHKKQFIDSIE